MRGRGVLKSRFDRPISRRLFLGGLFATGLALPVSRAIAQSATDATFLFEGEQTDNNP